MPATLNLTPDELLTTTRAVRKRLDFDRPVPVELSGSASRWRRRRRRGRTSRAGTG